MEGHNVQLQFDTYLEHYFLTNYLFFEFIETFLAFMLFGAAMMESFPNGEILTACC